MQRLERHDSLLRKRIRNRLSDTLRERRQRLTPGRLSTSVTGERIVDVAIPAATVTRFLDAVAGAGLVAGPYQPMIDHTDDCPSIELALQVDVGEFGRGGAIGLLFTESQGEFHAPWGACLRGEIYTVPGDEIGRALAGLRRLLKRPVLDRMMRKAGREASRR